MHSIGLKLLFFFAKFGLFYICSICTQCSGKVKSLLKNVWQMFIFWNQQLTIEIGNR